MCWFREFSELLSSPVGLGAVLDDALKGPDDFVLGLPLTLDFFFAFFAEVEGGTLLFLVSEHLDRRGGAAVAGFPGRSFRKWR